MSRLKGEGKRRGQWNGARQIRMGGGGMESQKLDGGGGGGDIDNQVTLQ